MTKSHYLVTRSGIPSIRVCVCVVHRHSLSAAATVAVTFIKVIVIMDIDNVSWCAL